VVPLSEQKIFQWNGKGFGATSAHFVTDEEWNYTTLYMSTNMEEVIPYFEGVSEQVASVVFHNSSRKVVKDAIKHARF
jgi:hypothetical protein